MKTDILKGTRDFLPQDKAKRDFVMQIIRRSFESFGYDTVETPAIEYAETLLGKYGDEGSKLVYSFEDNGGRKIALRYDQTVPFARLIAMYNKELPMPFKRYEISRVWRADKPAKGRYREFYQCDIDIIGTTSLLADAEVAAVINRVLTDLGLSRYVLKFNSRRVVNQIFEKLGVPVADQAKVLRVMDKVDKIGEDEIKKELRGFLEEKCVDSLWRTLNVAGSTAEKIVALGDYDTSEIESFLAKAKAFGVPEEKLEWNLTLARGLDYYTGIIFEGVIPEIAIGSICGGGRYDDLCGLFTEEKFSGTGVAFGFDRLVLAMEELGLLKDIGLNSQVLLANFAESETETLELMQELQAEGLKTEMYLDPAKLGKQLKFADKKKIPFVVIYGGQEVEKGEVLVRMMSGGKQINIPREQVATYFTGFDFSTL
jgi:histidyl-tRNA synthetase